MAYYPNYEPPRDKTVPSIPFWKSGGGIAVIIVGGVTVLILGVLLICCGLPLISTVINLPTPTPSITK